MKIEEAIQRLETHKEYISPHGRFTEEAIDMAIDALEKQIPKKFELVDGYIPVCPVCGEEIWDMEWCNSCGQRLDDDSEQQKYKFSTGEEWV